MAKSAKVIPLRASDAQQARRQRLRVLVRRTVAGDTNAANTLLREVAPALLKAARGMLGPHHPDIDDVLQDGLMRFLNALPSYREECTVLHFAVRIGIRAAADAARRTQRQTRIRDAYKIEPHVTRSTLSELEERELLGWLLGETLSPPQIEALIMRNAMGYSIEEIAQAVDAPVNTVRSRLGSAKRALRERLRDEPQLAQLFGRTL